MISMILTTQLLQVIRYLDESSLKLTYSGGRCASLLFSLTPRLTQGN